MPTGLSFLCAYLLGSFPTAYLLGKYRHGIDIREHGSGNIGTMNARRVMGWGAALLVFAIDVLKGAAVVYLALWTGTDTMIMAGLAVSGHNYPVWLRFKGGKGLATALGAVLATGQFWPLLIFGLAWIISFPLLRQVDKANLLGSMALLGYALLKGPDWGLSLLVTVIIIRHLQEVFKKPSA